MLNNVYKDGVSLHDGVFDNFMIAQKTAGILPGSYIHPIARTPPLTTKKKYISTILCKKMFSKKTLFCCNSTRDSEHEVEHVSPFIERLWQVLQSDLCYVLTSELLRPLLLDLLVHDMWVYLSLWTLPQNVSYVLNSCRTQ